MVFWWLHAFQVLILFFTSPLWCLCYGRILHVLFACPSRRCGCGTLLSYS